MKATDFREATFEALQGLLSGMRMRAYSAWLLYGPGTTREVAERSGLNLLTLRPRTTELMEMGLVELAAEQLPGHEGRYQAVTLKEWRRRRAALGPRPEQMVMGL